MPDAPLRDLPAAYDRWKLAGPEDSPHAEPKAWDEYAEDARQAIDRAMLATSHVERQGLLDKVSALAEAAKLADRAEAQREHEEFLKGEMECRQ
jgi:uncharacterized protein YjgD (DUF1641 family)